VRGKFKTLFVLKLPLMPSARGNRAGSGIGAARWESSSQDPLGSAIRSAHSSARLGHPFGCHSPSSDFGQRRTTPEVDVSKRRSDVL